LSKSKPTGNKQAGSALNKLISAPSLPTVPSSSDGDINAGKKNSIQR
jgi:hypothetical protein